MRSTKIQAKYNFFSPLLLFSYFLSHFGLLLLGNHPFWDDWALVDAPRHEIIETFRELGSFFNFYGLLHVTMLSVGPWFYRIATFILYYGIGYYFFLVLRRTRLLDERKAFMAAVFFLVLPFNQGRGALILFPYTFCLFLFALAWKRLPQNRIPSLLLFFLSFNMNSLLVFYLLPLIDDVRGFAVKSCSGRLLKPRGLLILLYQYIVFRPITFFLPFIYFIPKSLLFKPYGYYKGYNEHFSVISLFYSPLDQLRHWGGSVLQKDLSSIFVLAVSLVLIVILTTSFRRPLGPKIRVLGISLFVLFLGLFPYYVLGHVPTFTEWTSRHQILIPFGFSLLAYSIGLLGLRPWLGRYQCFYFYLALLCLLIILLYFMRISKSKSLFSVSWRLLLLSQSRALW